MWLGGMHIVVPYWMYNICNTTNCIQLGDVHIVVPYWGSFRLQTVGIIQESKTVWSL